MAAPPRLLWWWVVVTTLICGVHAGTTKITPSLKHSSKSTDVMDSWIGVKKEGRVDKYFVVGAHPSGTASDDIKDAVLEMEVPDGSDLGIFDQDVAHLTTRKVEVGTTFDCKRFRAAGANGFLKVDYKDDYQLLFGFLKITACKQRPNNANDVEVTCSDPEKLFKQLATTNPSLVNKTYLPPNFTLKNIKSKNFIPNFKLNFKLPAKAISLPAISLTKPSVPKISLPSEEDSDLGEGADQAFISGMRLRFRRRPASQTTQQPPGAQQSQPTEQCKQKASDSMNTATHQTCCEVDKLLAFCKMRKKRGSESEREPKACDEDAQTVATMMI